MLDKLYFLVEEREWINGQVKGEDLSGYTRQMLQDAAAFTLSLHPADPQDTDRNMLHEFTKRLYDKICHITEIEWEDLKVGIPFDVPYSALDEPPEDWKGDSF